MKKTTRLQELFQQEQIFVIPGGGCALHAKMVEACGYECAYMSGALTAEHILGLPDAGLITVTEMVQNAGRMANAISLPLISDSDQGFGNAVNVRRTVQSFIQAGVAGIHIEDQPFPKRCGFVKGKEIIPLDEAVGKYRAAVEAKQELDPDFVIIARCDARTAVGGGLEEAITRMKAQSLEEVKIARQELAGPLMATVIAIKPSPPLEEMQKLGLSAAFYPALAAFAGMIASWDFLQDFQQRGVQAEQELLQRTKGHPLGGLRFFDLVGFPEVREWEEKYLPKEQLTKYEQSQGLYDPTDKATLGR